MSGFTERLYRKGCAVWKASHRHPFLTELAAGTLAEERFAYYMKQDYVYLIDFAKLFAVGAQKAQDLETMGKFAELLHATLHTEMELHRQYAAKFGISRAELEKTKPSPTTVAYAKFMLEAAAGGTLADVTAALLPCMWSYREIGRELMSLPGALDHPLYRDWILMYGSAEFSELTDWLIGLMDRLAEGLPDRELQKLEDTFMTSSRFEYLFWDMAYRKEEWPV